MKKVKSSCILLLIVFLVCTSCAHLDNNGDQMGAEASIQEIDLDTTHIEIDTAKFTLKAYR